MNREGTLKPGALFYSDRCEEILRALRGSKLPEAAEAYALLREMQSLIYTLNGRLGNTRAGAMLAANERDRLRAELASLSALRNALKALNDQTADAAGP